MGNLNLINFIKTKYKNPSKRNTYENRLETWLKKDHKILGPFYSLKKTESNLIYK